MEQIPNTTPNEEQPSQNVPLNPKGRQRKTFGIVLIIGILVIGIGIALWFRVLPGVSMLMSTPTATPGIGVAVQGGGWEVIITNVHQETRLKAGIGFTEQSWTVNEGYVFLVVDVTFRQVDSSSSNLEP
jgi:hypothetical protein